MKHQKAQAKFDYSYDSNLLYSQKLIRGKRSKFLLWLHGALAQVLLIALYTVLSLFLIVPAVAFIYYDHVNAAVIIAIIIITVILIVPVRVVCKRGKLIKALRKIDSDASKVTMTAKKYASLYRASGKTDITIETPDTLFDIMIFPTLKPGKRLFFEPNGKVVMIISQIPFGKLGALAGIKPKRKSVPFVFESGVDGGNKHKVKILLLNPVPKSIYAFSAERNHYAESGPGEKITDYTVENIAGLSRLIENDVENN